MRFLSVDLYKFNSLVGASGGDIKSTLLLDGFVENKDYRFNYFSSRKELTGTEEFKNYIESNYHYKNLLMAVGGQGIKRSGSKVV